MGALSLHDRMLEEIDRALRSEPPEDDTPSWTPSAHALPSFPSTKPPKAVSKRGPFTQVPSSRSYIYFLKGAACAMLVDEKTMQRIA